MSKITRGGDNVFADLGWPKPSAVQAKVRLAAFARRLLEQRTPGPLRGISPEVLSALVDCRLDQISIFDAMRCLTALDRDVRIVINARQASGARGGRIDVEIT